MNEKNSYEKHLAERFEQLPPPGSASEHWPQMKALLDKDLPEGGGKGPGGFGRWWLYALVGGIIVTATLWFSNIGSTSDSENAPVISSVNTTAEEKEKITSQIIADALCGFKNRKEKLYGTAPAEGEKRVNVMAQHGFDKYITDLC